jgi:pentatricopeptide repeat protein
VVRALASHARGHRFKSCTAHHQFSFQLFTKELLDGLEITAADISTMLKRLGKATGIHCNPHSFRRGFCVHNVKSGLSNRVIQALGGWETPSMVSHYAASRSFDDALQVYHSMSSSK